VIRVSDLVKRFGPTLAVDRISFQVEKGEVVGFLGPNGAGKTTTIRVLTCYHPATSGLAEVAGHDVFQEPVEVRRAVGYLPENVPLYPDMRVEEYLLYRAALKGLPRGERRSAVGRAMERCDVEDVRRKLVGHISRGYRQRLGLADALVADPPILILDEPTTGLDPNQRRRLKNLVRELSADHTILFSSHVLSEVQEVSSRIIIIDRGQIHADGTPESLLERSRGRRLWVTAKLGADGLAKVLASVGSLGLAAVDELDGYATGNAEVEGDADPRDEVFARLQGAPVRELRLDLPSLEQFFQQVTEGDEASLDAAVPEEMT
jgi:ABC-2 type transport system ATP-binding protein